MEQLRQQLPIHYMLATIYTALIACVVVTPMPATTLCLPIIAYCSYRLYAQIKREHVDTFNVLFELGCLLASVTVFITIHTALYA